MTTTNDFVSGLEQGVVRVLACRACGVHQTLDPVICRRCGSANVVWIDIAGSGHVYATTEIYLAPTPEFKALLPYTLALVDLDGGGRVMGHCETGVAIGLAVMATIFHDAGLPLVRFVPAAADQ